MDSPPPLPPSAVIRALVAAALCEDVGDGDLTAALIDPGARASATLVCIDDDAVLCGGAWFEEAFAQVDADAGIEWRLGDGARLKAGDAVCRIEGNARALLTAERVAINLLQTLSATATAARRFCDAVGGRARITDTRKTVPGMRVAQKYAAAIGGARNHRIGLFDQVLIKENHIAAAGGIAEALRRARAVTGAEESRIEIEVENLAQLKEALNAGAKRIMLDNFTVDQLRDAVAATAGRAALEASGNITLKNARAVAATGVDLISAGAITKHINAVDFSLRFDSPGRPPAPR